MKSNDYTSANLLNAIEELPLKDQVYILARWLEPLKEILEPGVEYSELYKAISDWIDSAPADAIRKLSGRKWLAAMP